MVDALLQDDQVLYGYPNAAGRRGPRERLQPSRLEKLPPFTGGGRSTSEVSVTEF